MDQFESNATQRDHESARRALAESEVFAGLDGAVIDALLDASTVRPTRAGEVLCEPGDDGDCVALVVDGEFAVEAPGVTGPARLNRLGRGELFGEMAVLRRAPRSARVTAIEAGELLIIREAVFLSLLVHHPAISIRMLGSLSDRLQHLTQSVSDRRVFAAATAD